MAGRQRYSQREVITALSQTRGLVTFAAHQLRCDPDTVTNYCARYPAVRAARDAARARQLDVAEAKLFQAVDAGEAWALQFLLRTLGRARGYGDRLEVDAMVDVLSHPQWLRTRALLLGVLRAFPDAERAVVRALEAPGGGRDGDDGGGGG